MALGNLQRCSELAEARPSAKCGYRPIADVRAKGVLSLNGGSTQNGAARAKAGEAYAGGEAGVIGATIVWAAVLLYIFPPIWMPVRKGWPVRAGLTMLVASMLPIAAMVASGEDITPGAGMAVLVLAPFVLIALLTIGGGLIASTFRAHKPVEKPE